MLFCYLSNYLRDCVTCVRLSGSTDTEVQACLVDPAKPRIPFAPGDTHSVLSARLFHRYSARDSEHRMAFWVPLSTLAAHSCLQALEADHVDTVLDHLVSFLAMYFCATNNRDVYL